MKIPKAHNAEVPDRKITGYLLDHDHPQNKGKAAFYEIVGFTKGNSADLRAALLSHILDNEVVNFTKPILGFDTLLKAGCVVQMVSSIKSGQYGSLRTARKFLNW